MTPAHLHLALNHMPVLGCIVASALLLLGLWPRLRLCRSAGLLAALLAGLAVILVYLSGEEAEEAIEQRPEFSRALVHDHEEMAEIALWLVLGSGAIALGGLGWRQRRGGVLSALPQPYWALLLVSSLVAAGTVGYTASLGGLISHPELRASSASPDISAHPDANKQQHEKDED